MELLLVLHHGIQKVVGFCTCSTGSSKHCSSVDLTTIFSSSSMPLGKTWGWGGGWKKGGGGGVVNEEIFAIIGIYFGAPGLQYLSTPFLMYVMAIHLTLASTALSSITL